LTLSFNQDNDCLTWTRCDRAKGGKLAVGNRNQRCSL
jgi:hypothetical protein